MKNMGVYIVTGATGGIGSAIVRGLVERNVSRIVLACRNVQRANAVAEELPASGSDIEVLRLDLEDFSSVEAFVDEIKKRGEKVRALINNAGTMPGEVRITRDGYESATQTNFLAPMLLTERLIPLMEEGSAVVFTTSMTRRIARFRNDWNRLAVIRHNRFVTYGRSKKMVTAYASLLARRLESSGIRVNCSDPWIVDSGMITMNNKLIDRVSDKLFRPLIYTPEEGAVAALRALDSDKSGQIFTRRGISPIHGSYSGAKAEKIVGMAIKKISTPTC